VGNPDVLRLLIDAGAQVNAQNKYGATALMRGAIQPSAEAVRVLLDAKAAVNAVDEYEETALMKSTCSCHAVVIEALLGAGAHAEVFYRTGETTIHRVVDHYTIEWRGADPNEDPYAPLVQDEKRCLHALLAGLAEELGLSPCDLGLRSFELVDDVSMQSDRAEGELTR